MKNSHNDLYYLIEQIESRFSVYDAYSLYIEFCFEVIDKIDDRLSDDIKEIVQLAKNYWFNHLGKAQDLEDKRVSILKSFKKSKSALNVNFKTEVKLAISPLWTEPPSNDITDSFEWIIILLSELKFGETEILGILSTVYTKKV